MGRGSVPVSSFYISISNWGHSQKERLATFVNIRKGTHNGVSCRLYTLHANTKQFRKSHPLEADDIRMSLVGNSWQVGVAVCLLSHLAVQEGFISPLPIHDLLRRLRPGQSSSLSGFLFRPPLGGNPKPFAVNLSDKTEEKEVVSRLAHLVSSKGSDVLLTSQTESTPKSYRFRTSLPAKLWQWKTICGWRWRHQQRGPVQD